MGATIRIAVLANAAQARRELGTVTDTADKASKSMGSMFPTAAIAAGGAVVGAALFKAVQGASDLNETVSKSKAIFGAQQAAMDAWAGGAASSIGLSRSAALDAAASFGDMFQQLGMNQKAAADTSRSTVQLAADLGSFNNLPTADVVDRISAAYRGEYDSLQAVIPNINAARVEQEALAMSHKNSAKELTAQDKALAVNSILTKDGARAVGDFARTSEGAANKQKILAAEFQNISDRVGTALLPVFSAALTGIGALMNVMSNPAVQIFAAGVGAVAVALGIWSAITKTAAAVQMAFNIILMANPIGLVILAVIGLAAVLVMAYKKSETFRNIVNGAFQAVTGAASATWNWIKSNWPLLLAIITGPIGLAVLAIGKHKDSILKFMGEIPNKIKGVFANAGTLLLSAGSRIIDGLLSGIRSKFGEVKSTLDRFTGMLPDWKGPAKRDKTLLFGNGSLVMGGFQDGLASKANQVKSYLGRFTGSLSASAGVGSPIVSPIGTQAASQAGNVTVVLELTGDPVIDAIIKAIRARVRGGGGNVQTVLGAR